MTRYLLVSIFFSCIIVMQAGGQLPANPNVLFIAIDDLNDYVNCMNGSVKGFTPNIDRLASQATLFTNTHCQAPICGPSRASIMTGLYPSSTGNYLQLGDKNIKRGNDHVSKATFLPDYFEKFGYRTMAVGKIYHNGDRAETFDEYGGRFAGSGPKPAEKFRFTADRFPGKTGRTQTDWAAYPTHDSLLADYQSAEWAVKKLKQEYDSPFFLAVGFVRPHVPWYVPQKWFDLFPKNKITLPPYLPDDFDDIPEIAQQVADVPMMPTTEELIERDEWKDVLQAYLACIAFVDAQVGKVLDALHESLYANNTIIVLWSDHGYHLGEKNRFAKQALWERNTRSLLIIKDLEKNRGQICDAPTQLIDIYPTLVDLCGLPVYPMAEGHSLRPLLSNPKKKWTYPAFTFYGKGNGVVRDQRFRLTQYEDGALEIYDMRKDPEEWHNLAATRKGKKIARKLLPHLPDQWAPLSQYSSYEINPYFASKTKK